jgi:molybdopterin/thiamine biosynthesis adenylyltransferase/rhodanese-related sulfurtransferase
MNDTTMTRPAGAGALADRLQEIRRSVRELSPPEAAAAAGTGTLMIDIREPDEIEGGSPVGAVRLARGFLEIRIAQHASSLDTPVCVMCQSGTRSLLAAAALQSLGYTDVSSMQGGFAAWKQQGLPFDKPLQLSNADRRRYARHLAIPEVGEAGQLKLLSSKVLLIGAGGLGSPVAFYLAAAGVGTIGLVDDDVVDSSNLQRQILHTESRVGKKKVESAKETLLALNSDLEVDTYEERLNAANVERILTGYDVVVDGTDNFTARYLINDACVKLAIPNVHAAVFRFSGYVTVYSPKRHKSPCYRCDYPNPPPAEMAPSCADAGVLGVLPGVLGLLQAVEALKLIVGIGQPLLGRVLSYDALKGEFSEYHSEMNPDCPVCRKDSAQIRYEEVGQVCGMTGAPA